MNLIKNASFLDGSTGFIKSGGVFTVDETVFGAPGRSVLVLTTTPGSGNPMTISSDYPEGPAVTSGELLDVFVMGKSTIPNLIVKLQVEGGGEVQLEEKATHLGNAERGVPSTFRIFRGRITAPSTGQARITMTATASNGSQHIFAMFRPYMEKISVNARPRVWTPGLHFNTDLNLPIWPSNFPQFRAESVQVQPTSVRKAFGGDIPIPSTIRVSNTPAYIFKGELELSALEYDQLERLCYEQSDPFWFVRPDTVQLCQASWSEDGQPVASGSANVIRRVGIGLILQVV